MADFEENNDFENTGSGAALAVPLQCSALRKNGHVLIKNRPCKIVEMSSSKTGKHGACKVHLVGIDIFTGKKYEDISPSTANVSAPNVSKREYQLLNISDEGFLELMGDDSEVKDDVRLPDNKIGEEIRKRFDDGEELVIQVISSMGEEGVTAVKSDR